MSTAAHAHETVAIVVAAGSGTRLGADVPKALVQVGGVSLLRRSLTQLAAGGVRRAIVVVPPDARVAFEAEMREAPLPVVVVDGGAERQHSVAAGLTALGAVHDDTVVLVHDAARAFVPQRVVERVAEAVRGGAQAVIPVVPVTDSIREVTDTGSVVVDRSALRAVQTPQGFRRGILAEAHIELAKNRTTVTDDAAAAEYLGCEVVLVEGDRVSFKVTDPFDLVLAEALAERGLL